MYSNQSATQHQPTFSLQLFSTLSKLISSLNSHNSNLTNNETSINNRIKQLQSQMGNFSGIKCSKYQNSLVNFVKHSLLMRCNNNESQLKQQSSLQQQQILTAYQQSFRAFLNIFSQTKTRVPNIDHIVSNEKASKIIVCDQRKLYNLKEEINKKSQRRHKTQHSNVNITNSNHHHSRNISQNNNNTTTHNVLNSKGIIMNTKTRQSQQQSQASYKAYVIYGKAMNVERHKKNTPSSIISSNTQQQSFPHAQNQSTNFSATKNLSNQDNASKQQTINSLQYCMSLMYQQQKLLYSKCEPNELEDLLLTHYLQDPSLLPILVTNEVYKYFIPLDCAIILVVQEDFNSFNNFNNNFNNNNNNNQSPLQYLKQQTPFIFKDTLLHVYLDNMKILNKTISRESFYKNSTFRGIYFVEQGQVQTKSGRIVARGWVINGKCKSTTHVWKFHKVMTFFKYILHNQNIWKQFVNDLKLNNQWPIKVSDILNLEDKVYEQIMGQQSPNFKLGHGGQRNKKLKFPPISGRLNRSFDITKLNEIEKMKHFDEKIHHLHELKQQVLKKKIQHNAKKFSMHNRHNQSLSDAQSKQMNKRIHILSQKMNIPQKTIKTDVSRSLFLPPGQSPANILITGIVQKLKSIHENSPNNNDSMEKSPREQTKRKLMEINKSRTKILGLKRYDQIMRYEKNHLYKGKNYYN